MLINCSNVDKHSISNENNLFLSNIHIDSFDDSRLVINPIHYDGVYIQNTNIGTFKNIHKRFKSINKLELKDVSVGEGLINILLINNLKQFSYQGVIPVMLGTTLDIITKYHELIVENNLDKHIAVLHCAEELIDKNLLGHAIL